MERKINGDSRTKERENGRHKELQETDGGRKGGR